MGRQASSKRTLPADTRRRPAIARRQFGLHLGAFRHFAHDVVEHVRRRCGRAVAQHIGRHGLNDFDVEIGGGELELALGGFDQHVG